MDTVFITFTASANIREKELTVCYNAANLLDQIALIYYFFCKTFCIIQKDNTDAIRFPKQNVHAYHFHVIMPSMYSLCHQIQYMAYL